MNTNSLIQIHEQNDIYSILERAKDSSSTILAWRLVGGKKVTVEIKLRVIRKNRSELVFNVSGDSNFYHLQNMISGSLRINFYFSGELILFQADVKSLQDHNNFIVYMPQMVAQVERRKALRFSIDEEPISINFEKILENKVYAPKFFKKCFDISSGGLSFILTKTEANFFKMNEEIQIDLSLPSLRKKLKGKIVNLVEFIPSSKNKLNYKGIKVSLSFLNIDEKLKKEIDMYVFNSISFNQDAL